MPSSEGMQRISRGSRTTGGNLPPAGDSAVSRAGRVTSPGESAGEDARTAFLSGPA